MRPPLEVKHLLSFMSEKCSSSGEAGGDSGVSGKVKIATVSSSGVPGRKSE